jgi:3-hydroxyisobutyrate dehydrogenase-like beta-hydroxyacid dehydrogenase
MIKVITNMLAFIHLKACGEALMLAKRGGLDLGQAWAAIKASSGNVLRARNRGRADPERLLRHRLQHRPGAEGSGLRAWSSGANSACRWNWPR